MVFVNMTLLNTRIDIKSDVFEKTEIHLFKTEYRYATNVVAHYIQLQIVKQLIISEMYVNANISGNDMYCRYNR